MPEPTKHSVVTHFSTPINHSEVQQWASKQRLNLPGPVSFALVFCSVECVDAMQELMEIIRIDGQVVNVIGCTGSALIANQNEIENDSGVSVALYHLPATTVHARHLPSECFQPDESYRAIEQQLGPECSAVNSWLLFASPESIGHEDWLKAWDQATGGRVTLGGFASATLDSPKTTLFYNGQSTHDGAVALGFEGEVELEPITSNGCRPIGHPWVVTQAERNIIHEIGNRPILEVLRDTLEGMSQQEQKQAHGNVFIGLVMNEYKQNFRNGDFLVRNLAAIDPETGSVAIATPLRVGQNLQFQIRDPRVAEADFSQQLEDLRRRIGKCEILGACLCDCIGRGTSLYGVPNHDVEIIQGALPQLPIAGVFCNGEFGQVDGRTRLHGYAASLGLFVKRC